MICGAADRAGAILEIDLGAIAANWRFLAARAAPAECASVVKADGYGLGAAPVACALAAAGCRFFFVATLDEGIALRRALGDSPEIAVLNGPLPRTAGEFVEHGLIPVLNEPGQIAEWEALEGRSGGTDPHPALTRLRGRVGEGIPAATQTAARGTAILHLDTGMARLGLTQREFAALLDNPPAIRWRALMSHLACADTPQHPMNEQQRTRFAAAIARVPGTPASLAASSGIFLGPEYHFALVRPGAGLYGINPCLDGVNPLSPVVRLSGKILQIRQIDRGEPVGYGAEHAMAGPGRAATVGLGYADGWLRSLGGRGCGFIGGHRVPLIGRVSMDLVTFDLSGLPEEAARPGDWIELIGPGHGLDAVAAEAGTIGYEILTALGARYHRIYRDADRELFEAGGGG
jgi:alanine racemase